LEIERSYSYCPKCKQGFFPLDLELELLPNTAYTPLLQEGFVRLGAALPFRQARRHFQYFTGVKASEASLRRMTERAGTMVEEYEEAQVNQLEEEPSRTDAVKGLEVAFLSADGCNVPVVGGEWKEVKTLVIGEVERPVEEKGQVVVRTSGLSYFSRCLPIEKFKRASIGEVQRRGLEEARVVCAPCDGADYLQGLLDFHRADAVRILDFPHAAEHVAEAGKTVLGEGSEVFTTWFESQRHLMKHSNGAEIIGVLEGLRQEMEKVGEVTKLKVVERNLNYLKERREMIRYAHFRELGYPIGSGATESANKIVVEARLKGAGMHWAEEHLNPMLSLRNLSCNERWEEDWLIVQAQWPYEVRRKRYMARKEKQQAVKPAKTGEEETGVSTTDATQKAPLAVISAVQTEKAPEEVGSKEGKKPWRPGSNHPWRQAKIGRALYSPNPNFVNAKN